MTLWLLFTLLTTAVAVLVAIPVIRRIEAPPSDRDRILAVSRDQMSEIESETARGAMTTASSRWFPYKEPDT